MKRILIVTGLILASFTMVLAQKKLSNELIWASPAFYQKGVSGFRSTNNGLSYTKLDYDVEGSSINKYSFKTGKKVAELVNGKTLTYKGQPIKISTYKFSSKEDKILLGTEVEAIYRRSSKGNFFIYDLKSKEVYPLSDFEKGKQIHPEFSPNGDWLSFVRDNNIYITDGKRETQITTDGKWNEVINGMCDWVYEEEFGFTKAYEWSPSGNFISFIRFDESAVKEFNMTYYKGLYPDIYTFKYPKAGEDNSKVSVHIYAIDKKETKTVDLGNETDFYVPRIQWMGDTDELLVTKMNRHQSKMELFKTNFDQPTTTLLHQETSETYVDLGETYFEYLGSGKGFVITSERDGYIHLYKHSDNGKFENAITTGKWEVTKVYGVDAKAGKVYFQAAKNSAVDKGIYVASIKGGSIKALSTETGQNSATFTKSFKYFLNNYSDANTPKTVALYDNRGKQVRVLEDNKALKENLKEYGLAKKEFMTIPTANGDLNAWMIKPANFDATKKYPVLMMVYGGPGSNTVLNRWDGANMLWHQLLAQKGYIVVSVDGHGTMFRGTEFKKSTYLQLGKLETEDQINAAKYLANQSYIDGARIGIQGWSYGGYMSSLCMTKGADVFKAGIAVAPVTNWRYYDSIYTERFMRTPQENASGYDDNSPINHVEKLKGAYLLVHGDADDNVHPQNTMEMITALVNANKQFDLFIYPNKNHGIYGGNTRNHLFTKMTNFLEENL